MRELREERDGVDVPPARRHGAHGRPCGAKVVLRTPNKETR